MFVRSGRIDYIGQRDQLNRMTELLKTNPFIHSNSVNFWYDDFQNWLNQTRQGNAQQTAGYFLLAESLYALSLSPRLEKQINRREPSERKKKRLKRKKEKQKERKPVGIEAK